MRPIAYDITPQGFRVPLYDDKRRGDGPDSLVVESCALLASDPSGFTHSWDFQRKIINRGLDLFGDFHQFLKAQDMHGNLTVHQRGFLEDTVQFIRTGKRSMSIETRIMCLMAEMGHKHPTIFTPSRSTRSLVDMLGLPSEDYMYHWIGHARGFTDMVCTLNVIFGSTQKNVAGIK